MKKFYSLLSLITFFVLFNITSVFSQATVKTVSSFDSNGTYKIGDQIDLVFWFSEAITVSGTPRLELETGSSDAFATYQSGSGSAFLTFRYTVSEGESSSDLAYTSTSALANNGGSSMLASGGSAATLTLPAVGSASSLSGAQAFVIDGVKPTMTITASQGSDGFSSNDSTLSLTFTSSESTTTFASGDVTVSGGTLSSFSGSGTTYTATFTPTGGEGAKTIDVAAQTYKDAAGNDNSAASQFNWTYDTTAPTVSGVDSSTNAGTYIPADAISIQVAFTEAVTVTGTPQLTLETGASDAVVDYASGSGGTTLTFTYTVQAGDISSDLDYKATTSLGLNGGTIKDAAGTRINIIYINRPRN